MIKKFTLIMFLALISFNVYAKEKIEFNKCVDGDTFKAIYKEETVTIRLLAVDTPETKHPTKGVEPYGKEASEYVCNLLKSSGSITIEFDDNSDLKDKYDRYLAWVFIDNNLLQNMIISKGYGKVAYLYGDYKYTSLLEIEEIKAKKNKLGIWSEEEDTDYYKIIFIIILLLLMYLLKIKIPYKKLKKIF